ncbi:hypothetical protein OPT61_g3134 [Boeremia exigua]|uniref:Uncharacterized protein n=1 Tax=Boeremia exigua TaxID=749465 RepID=A0ACC2IJ46_9PLEO|nr:hypothetical protein OPT61_g3134 [Boeremia exigua]
MTRYHGTDAPGNQLRSPESGPLKIDYLRAYSEKAGGLNREPWQLPVTNQERGHAQANLSSVNRQYVACDLTIVFSAGAVMQLREVVPLFSRCDRRHKANNDKLSNPIAHDLIVVKLDRFLVLPTRDMMNAFATIFTTCAEHELLRAIAHGSSAGEIFDGSERRLAEPWRPSQPRNASSTPASEIVNGMPATQGPSSAMQGE